MKGSSNNVPIATAAFRSASLARDTARLWSKHGLRIRERDTLIDELSLAEVF